MKKEIYDKELGEKIKHIIDTMPRQTMNGIYWDMVSIFGRDFMEKKNWDQDEVYRTIKAMRNAGGIPWNSTRD